MARNRFYSCQRCLRKFADKNELNQHRKNEHGRQEQGRATYQPTEDDICPYCNHRFAGNAGVDWHLRFNKKCGALHAKWATEISSAPASEHTSSSIESGSNSDRFDNEPMVSSEDEEMQSLHNSDRDNMSIDSPGHSPAPNDDQESVVCEQGDDLDEIVDTGGHTVYVERFPNPHAGAAIRKANANDLPPSRCHYPDVGALANPEAFEIAELLMESGVSGRFRNRYLTLKRIRDRMPWHNNRMLLKDIDKLPHGPEWVVKHYKLDSNMGSKVAEFWKRDPLSVIRGFLLDRTLGRHMQWTPERHYTCRRRKQRRRDELWTADWLWRVQEMIQDDYATLISCIVASDETKLTNFSGDKKAHPVYLTIGNLPKRLRKKISKRATVLIGYLPVPKLDCETRPEEKRQMKRDLFHRCMEELLAPLTEACENGGVEAACADGSVRRIYPVLAAYVADFPEQCKVACTKQTHCPLCTVHPKTRGDPGDSPLRDRDDVLNTMATHEEKGSKRFVRQGLLPVRPFWHSHPYVDIGTFITPDLLHQVHKGVMKDHLIKWVTTILQKPMIDERYVSMPEYHGMRHFKHGISSISQWTGRELKEMVKILLPAISDSNERVVRAARSLMDFMYLSHAASLTDEDLNAMDDALRTFHNHKDVFQELGAVATDKGFHGIPKIHMISHYTHLIRELGTPDGYNTETSERLHIDFAKMGYRASNKVNAIKQMALYIQRLEAIAMHATYLEERRQEVRAVAKLTDPEASAFDGQVDMEAQDEEYGFDLEDEEWDAWFDPDIDEPNELADAGVIVEPTAELYTRAWDMQTVCVGDADDGDEEAAEELFYPNPVPIVAKTPTVKDVTTDFIIQTYGASRFIPALRSFLGKHAPKYRNAKFDNRDRFNLWSRARLFHSPPPFKPSEGPHIDVIRAQPEQIDQFGRVSQRARFDTVLFFNREDRVGIHRYRAGRVRVLFELPSQIHQAYPHPLAYVELFNYWSQDPTEPAGLFTTTRTLTDGNRSCMIVPLSSIRLTCHLAPKYSSREIDHYLTLQSDTLQLYPTFFLNIFASYFIYELMRHWGQDGMWRSDLYEEDQQEGGEGYKVGEDEGEGQGSGDADDEEGEDEDEEEDEEDEGEDKDADEDEDEDEDDGDDDEDEDESEAGDEGQADDEDGGSEEHDDEPQPRVEPGGFQEGRHSAGGKADRGREVGRVDGPGKPDSQTEASEVSKVVEVDEADEVAGLADVLPIF